MAAPRRSSHDPSACPAALRRSPHDPSVRTASPRRRSHHEPGQRTAALNIAAFAAMLLGARTDAAAESTAPARTLHGSAGAGGSILMTGSQGDRFRLDLQIDLKPRSRYGVLLAWRAFDEDHRGLVTAGLLYEGAAARPTLVLDLHADVGVDLDQRAPLIGGGIRPTLQIIGPLGLVYDGGAYLVLDGVDNSRLQLQSTLLLVARW